MAIYRMDRFTGPIEYLRLESLEGENFRSAMTMELDVDKDASPECYSAIRSHYQGWSLFLSTRAGHDNVFGPLRS